MRIFTIGYEAALLDEFLKTLIAAEVQHLVDVRELPLSRKKGFSKRKLSEALTAVGIRYTHLRDLGDPKAGREAARRGDFKSFRQIFALHMSTSTAKQALSELEAIASQGGACLMCFEKSAIECHRSIVAEAIQKRTGLEVLHLRVGRGLVLNERGCKQAA